ncbi:MAG TPA: hypothetical protein PK264_18375 [Hyphomicrobiaceae bacterium]|nr:hypothetical protein [Hyphomicrobiaceae bacterium]
MSTSYVRRRGQQLANLLVRAWAPVRALSITALLALPLTACLDGRVLVDIKPGGLTEIEVEVRGAPEFASIVELVAAAGDLKSENNPLAGKSLCHAMAEGINQSNELKAKAPPLIATSVRLLEGARPGCVIRMAITEPLSDEVVKKLGDGLKTWNAQVADMMPGLVSAGKGLTLVSDGPRRVRIVSEPGPALSLNETRDLFVPLIKRLVADEMMKGKPMPGLPAGTLARIMDDANLAKLVESGMRANLAAYRIALKGYEDYRIDIELAVPRIIETNLERKGDRLSLGQSYGDFLKAMADPKTVPPRPFVLVFEY